MPAAPQRELFQGVATSRTNSRAAACPTAEGDCLVVINSRGEYRDGIGWVLGWDGAFQFRLPTPAYEMCDVAAREAQRQTNVSGAVGSIPPGTPASVVPHSFPLVGALPGLRRRPLPPTTIETGIYLRVWPDIPAITIGTSDLAPPHTPVKSTAVRLKTILIPFVGICEKLQRHPMDSRRRRGASACGRR